MCRAVGETGKYGPNKNHNDPPRAKFTGTNRLYGAIALFGDERYSMWYFDPDLLSI